jgi:putative phosphoesterase
MKKIGLLSDTHSYLDDRILYYLKDCDEIWHAGDWGSVKLSDTLEALGTVRGVYGNIDGNDLRLIYPELNIFNCEGKKIMLLHIVGSPGKYYPGVRAEINKHRPDSVVCGHSHILRIQQDKELNFLYMNPGAAGRHGFHKVRTMLTFEINQGKIEELKAIELGPRTKEII